MAILRATTDIGWIHGDAPVAKASSATDWAARKAQADAEHAAWDAAETAYTASVRVAAPDPNLPAYRASPGSGGLSSIAKPVLRAKPKSQPQDHWVRYGKGNFQRRPFS